MFVTYKIDSWNQFFIISLCTFSACFGSFYCNGTEECDAVMGCIAKKDYKGLDSFNIL